MSVVHDQGGVVPRCLGKPCRLDTAAAPVAATAASLPPTPPSHAPCNCARHIKLHFASACTCTGLADGCCHVHQLLLLHQPRTLYNQVLVIHNYAGAVCTQACLPACVSPWLLSCSHEMCINSLWLFWALVHLRLTSFFSWPTFTCTRRPSTVHMTVHKHLLVMVVELV